jgi:hypothetical protein
MSNVELFATIDRLIANIDAHRLSPHFETELSRRTELEVPHLADNRTVLRHIAHIIAFANADSKRVKAMVESGAYDKVWQEFDLELVSKMNPCEIAEQHWATLSSIRSRTKIFQVVMAARALLSRANVAKFLNDCDIPRKAVTLEQVAQFWVKFKELQNLMAEADIPFVRSTTSLSHLLLHLGYDCIKPDVIVMRVAQRLKIIDDDPKKDKNLRKVARVLQEYAVSRGMRPGVVDMYFLIQEGQSEARDWVQPNFKPVY